MRHAFAIVVSLILCVVADVGAQVVEVPTFQVTGFDAAYPSVAAGLDGNLMFLWSHDTGQDREAFTRRFSATGMPLADPMRIDDSGWVHKTGISATPTGGFIAVWHYESPHLYSAIYGQNLNALGSRVGGSYEVANEVLFGSSISVAALPSGPVFFWAKLTNLLLAIYDYGGLPSSGTVEIGDGWIFSDVAALSNGGFVIVWWGFAPGLNLARVYDGGGIPQGTEPFVVSDEITPLHVAAGPNGEFVVVGTGPGDSTAPGAVWFRRFSASGTPTGAPVLVFPAGPDDIHQPDVALDEQGNVYVAWTSRNDASGVRAPPRARAFGPDDQPLGPAIDLDPSPATDLQVAHISNGGFVNTWTNFSRAYANVVSLCAPGAAVCGDGVVQPQCEQCDDGAGNSDTAPDACRSDCTRPRCRDGVVDAFEACDDGDLMSCDGCSIQCVSEPGLTCGDGITNPTCGQHCDDANGVVGDGCAPTCQLERIPGGGSAKSDCLIEWQVNNPVNVPFLDKRGALNQKQQCIDDDPQCDFDGGTPGGCTFLVRVCANNTDVAGCQPGTRLASWKLVAPNEAKAAKDPALAATRTAFLSTVPAAIVGPSLDDICSGDIAVTVPLRPRAAGAAAGKLKLLATSALYDGRTDKDTLRLTCLPAGAP